MVWCRNRKADIQIIRFMPVISEGLRYGLFRIRVEPLIQKTKPPKLLSGVCVLNVAQKGLKSNLFKDFEALINGLEI
jgi:hypothetical protein